jgi:hypothetical protein
MISHGPHISANIGFKETALLTQETAGIVE